MLSHPSCCLVVFGAAAPRREVVLYHGSGICRRTRQQHAERGHQQRDTALVRNFVVLCVDVGAAPLRRHGTVVTVVVLGTAVVSRAAVARAAVAAGVTSHPLRHGTVVTVVVLGTAVVSRAAVAVGVCGRSLVWCHSNHTMVEIMTPWSWRHARAWPLGAKGLWAYCPSYTARSTQQK